MKTSKHTPKKRFGQNFLRNEVFIEYIRNAIAPTEGDHIVEIGPGEGALTQQLLSAPIQLDLVEIDRDLIEHLENIFASHKNVNIFPGDALAFDFKKLCSTPNTLRIVGNLPYNISTPILFHLLTQLDSIKDMHFLLQKEVVDRITAPVGDKHYGRLAIMLQYHCSTTSLFSVPPDAFFPAPKVNSAFVRLVPHASIKNPATDLKKLEAIVKQAFMYRRKTIHNSLKGTVNSEQLKALGINPNLRPQDLSIDNYVDLSNSLACEAG